MKQPGEDEDMSQLRLLFLFTPTNESAALGHGSKWCDSPGDLHTFESFIASSAPYRAFGQRAPDDMEFYFQEGL